MPLEGESLHLEEEMYKGNNKRGMTEEEISLLLFQTMESIIEDLKEIEREYCRMFLRGFEDEASPSYYHDGCGNSATHANPQHNSLPTCIAGRMKEEDEAIGGAALQLKGMSHGWWFENYASYYHANVK